MVWSVQRVDVVCTVRPKITPQRVSLLTQSVCMSSGSQEIKTGKEMFQEYNPENGINGLLIKDRNVFKIIVFFWFSSIESSLFA